MRYGEYLHRQNVRKPSIEVYILCRCKRCKICMVLFQIATSEKFELCFTFSSPHDSASARITPRFSFIMGAFVFPGSLYCKKQDLNPPGLGHRFYKKSSSTRP